MFLREVNEILDVVFLKKRSTFYDLYLYDLWFKWDLWFIFMRFVTLTIWSFIKSWESSLHISLCGNFHIEESVVFVKTLSVKSKKKCH